MFKKIINFARFAYSATIEETKNPEPVITGQSKANWFANNTKTKRRFK